MSRHSYHIIGAMFFNTKFVTISAEVCEMQRLLTPLLFIIRFIFLNIWVLRDLTQPRLEFFPRSSIDIVIVISGFCQEMEPRYSTDWGWPDRNVKITSSDVKIYILFSLNRIYNNTLPPSGITIKSKYCWIHCLNWSSQRSLYNLQSTYRDEI